MRLALLATSLVMLVSCAVAPPPPDVPAAPYHPVEPQHRPSHIAKPVVSNEYRQREHYFPPQVEPRVSERVHGKDRESAYRSEQRGSCGSKTYCTEMQSCQEARFYLEQCGLQRLDKDGDGIPCENLCRH